MKIPLGGFEVTVGVVDELKDPESQEALYGLYDNLRISICRSCDPDRRLEVFLHEFVHAIETNYGLDLSEQDVQTLGMNLHQGLCDYLEDLKSHLATL